MKGEIHTKSGSRSIHKCLTPAQVLSGGVSAHDSDCPNPPKFTSCLPLFDQRKREEKEARINKIIRGNTLKTKILEKKWELECTGGGRKGPALCSFTPSKPWLSGSLTTLPFSNILLNHWQLSFLKGCYGHPAQEKWPKVCQYSESVLQAST